MAASDYVGVKGYFTDLTPLNDLDIQTFLEDKKELILIDGKNNKSKNSELPKKLLNLKENIETYFKENKPYLESDVTLVSLAEKLGTTREYLIYTLLRTVSTPTTYSTLCFRSDHPCLSNLLRAFVATIHCHYDAKTRTF